MEKRPLNPDDIFQISCVGDPQVSPDGRSVAYVRQHIEKEKEQVVSDIFIADIRSGTSRRLTSSGKDHTPRWSPDGKRIAFISTRTSRSQIWVIDVSGGEAWHVPTKEEVHGDIQWSPDGKTIFYSAKVFSKPAEWVPYPGCPEDDRDRAVEQARRAMKAEHDKEADKNQEKKPNDIKVITRLRYRMDGAGYFGDLRRQVFAVKVPEPQANEEPSVSCVTSGDYDHHFGSVSFDGNFVVVSALRADDADYHIKQDLWLFRVDTGKVYLLYDAPGPVSNPKWSPGGEYIAFLGHDSKRNVSTRTDLYVLPVGKFIKELGEGKEPKPLTLEDAVNLTGHLDCQAGALISSDPHFGGGSPVTWDRTGLYFTLGDHGAIYIYRITAEQLASPPETWKPERLYGSPDRAISGFHASGGTIVAQVSTPVETENLFALIPRCCEDTGCRDYEEIKITRENEAFLSEISLGKWEKFTYSSRDGQQLDGWLVYPAGEDPAKLASGASDRKFPLVVMVHGGPHGAYGSAFMMAAQLFAGRGYAVAYFNPRGSTTYGQEFMACIDGDWGNKDYKDIMDGVEAVLSKGFVDEKNMFVYGWSYGGYMTTWIVTQTDRFKAACAGAPVSDLHSDYGTTDIMWADEHEYGGKPWEKAELLLERSPLTHVQKVTTPILLLHGENDMRCPVIQSEEFYVALKRLGKTAVFVRYPGEFHGLKRPLHRVDRYKRLIAWFEYHRMKG